MRKIICTLFILSLLITPLTSAVENGYIGISPRIAYAQDGIPVEEGFDDPESSAIVAASQPSTRSNCDGNVFYCALVEVFEYAASIIALIPIFITSYMVHISGLLLNFAIVDTVVEFSTHFDRVAAVNETWGVLRDLANILFIFGLLVIAIATIIGLSSYGYKQLLARLLIIALVINFSLLFTKVVIDTSNIFALQFYQGIAGKSREAGISNAFTKHLGIPSLFETGAVLETLQRYASKESGIGLVFTYSAFTSVFFAVTAFVFFFAAIMLLIRAVGFILLAILSPLAFAAMILPKTQKLAELWWEKLWQYAIFAPMMLLLFWVTVKIMPGIAGSIGDSGGLLQIFSTKLENRASATSLIMNFLILTILMLASVMLANKLSLAGSKTITGWGIGAAGLAGKGFWTAGITWPLRRIGALAAEIESGRPKTRSKYNPMRYLMGAVRPIGKGVMAVPGVGGLARQGLQRTALVQKAAVEERQAELEKYTSLQLVRRLSSTTLPINRSAIAKVLEKRNDFDDLGFDDDGVKRARMVRRSLTNAGLSTRKINRLRPDSFTKEEIENGELEKAIVAMKTEDIANMHEDVIRKAPQEVKEAIANAMVRNFSAKQANAAIRRLDDVGKEYLETLKKEAGSDNLDDIARYLDTGVESFNKKEPEQRIKVTQENVDGAIAKAARTKNPKDIATANNLRQQRARIMTVHDYIQRAPSQRAWGIKGGAEDFKRQRQQPGDTTTSTGSKTERDAIDDDVIGEDDQTT